MIVGSAKREWRNIPRAIASRAARSGDGAPAVAGGRSRCRTVCDDEYPPSDSEPRSVEWRRRPRRRGRLVTMPYSVRRRGRRRHIGFALSSVVNPTLNPQRATLNPPTIVNRKIANRKSNTQHSTTAIVNRKSQNRKFCNPTHGQDIARAAQQDNESHTRA